MHYRTATTTRHESIDSAVRDLSELDVDIDEDITMCFPALAGHAKERTGAMMKKVRFVVLVFFFFRLKAHL